MTLKYSTYNHVYSDYKESTGVGFVMLKKKINKIRTLMWDHNQCNATENINFIIN